MTFCDSSKEKKAPFFPEWKHYGIQSLIKRQLWSDDSFLTEIYQEKVPKIETFSRFLPRKGDLFAVIFSKREMLLKDTVYLLQICAKFQQMQKDFFLSVDKVQESIV